MGGSTALRATMIGLVLVNLVFVQLTEAAGMRWLLPLYVLTILTPVLSRWKDRLVYRCLWNGGILTGFVDTTLAPAAGSRSLGLPRRIGLPFRWE